MVAAHSPYSSNVILSPSFLFVFSRRRRGDLSETSYIAGAEFSANGGSRRVSPIAAPSGDGLLSKQKACTQSQRQEPHFVPRSRPSLGLGAGGSIERRISSIRCARTASASWILT